MSRDRDWWHASTRVKGRQTEDIIIPHNPMDCLALRPVHAVTKSPTLRIIPNELKRWRPTDVVDPSIGQLQDIKSLAALVIQFREAEHVYCNVDDRLICYSIGNGTHFYE